MKRGFLYLDPLELLIISDKSTQSNRNVKHIKMILPFRNLKFDLVHFEIKC